MDPKRIKVTRELRTGGGPEGFYRVGDAVSLLPELIRTYAGKVKLIYLDPPYTTGDRFVMRVRVGEAQWKSGNGKLVLETFRDDSDRDSFLRMMREVLFGCWELLSEDGALFLHIDYRAGAWMRVMLDEIFGEENFRNEIIWSYQSGGRSKKHFSRKHDTILFYSKSDAYDFHVEDVLVTPSAPKSNHMRRHVDPDGRVYRSIKSGGKVYTYYDDEPVAPSDVWTDISHLQQRDPERTGYDTQKPMALLSRIIRCASRKGDLVMDLFAGSGTALAAAQREGRRFAGADACPLTLNIMRRRLGGGGVTLEVTPSAGDPSCGLTREPGVGFDTIRLDSFTIERSVMPEGIEPPAGLDGADSWSVGYLRGEGYQIMDESIRSHDTPALKTELKLPVYAGTPAACVCDVLGRSFYYTLE